MVLHCIVLPGPYFFLSSVAISQDPLFGWREQGSILSLSGSRSGVQKTKVTCAFYTWAY